MARKLPRPDDYVAGVFHVSAPNGRTTRIQVDENHARYLLTRLNTYLQGLELAASPDMIAAVEYLCALESAVRNVQSAAYDLGDFENRRNRLAEEGSDREYAIHGVRYRMTTTGD